MPSGRGIFWGTVAERYSSVSLAMHKPCIDAYSAGFGTIT